MNLFGDVCGGFQAVEAGLVLYSFLCFTFFEATQGLNER